MSKLADALRELLELISDADVIPSTAHNPVEWDTVLSAAIHNARAALAADGWQPIETAPIKPFGEVPSYYTFQAVIAHRVGERVCVSEGVFSYTRNGKHSWRTMFGVVKPTHWQPLPAPPKE